MDGASYRNIEAMLSTDRLLPCIYVTTSEQRLARTRTTIWPITGSAVTRRKTWFITLVKGKHGVRQRLLRNLGSAVAIYIWIEHCCRCVLIGHGEVAEGEAMVGDRPNYSWTNGQVERMNPPSRRRPSSASTTTATTSRGRTSPTSWPPTILPAGSKTLSGLKPYKYAAQVWLPDVKYQRARPDEDVVVLDNDCAFASGL
jgi:hypothetical protein